MTESEYKKRKYDMRKREHRCVRCGEQDSRTMHGKVYCARCAYMVKESKERYAAKNPDLVKERKQRLIKYRIENNLCTRCGNPVSGNHKLCDKCLAKEKLRHIRRREAGYRLPKTRPNGPEPYDGIPRVEWPQYGFCYQCGDPLDQNMKICKKCYNVKLKNLAKGRAIKKQLGCNRWIQNNRNYWSNWRKAHGWEERECGVNEKST